MPSTKKKKKGSQIPAVDPPDPDPPALPRRNDDGLPPIIGTPQQSSPPSGVNSSSGSHVSQDYKIDEVSNASATSGITSPSCDLPDRRNIDAIDFQLLEYADAGLSLTVQQKNDCTALLKERGNMVVDTLIATPVQIRSLAQIVDSNRQTSIVEFFTLPGESSTPPPSASSNAGILSASDKSKIESRIKQPEHKELDTIFKQASGSSASALTSNQKQALVAILLRNTGHTPNTIPSLQPPASNSLQFRSVKSMAVPTTDTRPGSASLPPDLIAVFNTLTEAWATCMHQGTVPIPPHLLPAIHAAQYTSNIIITSLIYVMDSMQSMASSNLPPGFLALHDSFKRIASGERPDTFNHVPEDTPFNPNQVYSFLATSPSDPTISAGYMAFNALFNIFSKGASKLREVLLQVLTFNMYKGEGVLPAAERFLRFVDNAQDDAGNEGGDPGVLSIFFDPLLLVNIFLAQVEYALKKDFFHGEPVLQTSAAAFVAAFHSVTGQTRRDTFGSLRLVIAMLNRQPSIYQNTPDYSPKTPKIPSQAAYNAAGKGVSKGKGKGKGGKGKSGKSPGKGNPSSFDSSNFSDMGQQQLGDLVMDGLRKYFDDDFASKVLQKVKPPKGKSAHGSWFRWIISETGVPNTIPQKIYLDIRKKLSYELNKALSELRRRSLNDPIIQGLAVIDGPVESTFSSQRQDISHEQQRDLPPQQPQQQLMWPSPPNGWQPPQTFYGQYGPPPFFQQRQLQIQYPPDAGRGQGFGGIQSVLNDTKEISGPASGGGGGPAYGHNDVDESGAYPQGGTDDLA